MEDNCQKFIDFTSTNSSDARNSTNISGVSSHPSIIISAITNRLTNASVVCPPVWDSLLCWGSAQAGIVARVPCSQVFQVMGVPEPESSDFRDAYASRECGLDGSWLTGNWTNYTECLPFLTEPGESSESVLGVFVGFILFVGSFLSLVLLLVSLFIFFYFKSLLCTRLRVHRNLFVALIINSALLIVISGPVVMKSYFPFKYANHSWACRFVVASKLYASMASVNWMFVEGLLLHHKLSGVFSEGPPFLVYYLVGWGLPAGIIILWSSIMSHTLESSCWSGYSKSPYIWILTIPMFMALIANALFLVNIIRILVVKIKDTVTGEMRKALRATALLFPLLGMNQLLFCVNPREELEEAYLLFNSILQSSQGMVVSILYCFINTQVKAVIKATYHRHKMVRNINSTIRVNNNEMSRNGKRSTVRVKGETAI